MAAFSSITQVNLVSEENSKLYSQVDRSLLID